MISLLNIWKERCNPFTTGASMETDATETMSMASQGNVLGTIARQAFQEYTWKIIV